MRTISRELFSSIGRYTRVEFYHFQKKDTISLAAARVSMEEKEYYENRDLWTLSRRWDDHALRLRFSETINLIPSDVNSLMDLGCGNGIFLKLIGQTRANIRRIGLDRSTAALAEAQTFAGCPVLKGSVEAIPFTADAFDCITALELIEHLPEPAYSTALREIERVAKNHIIISTPFDEILIQVICPICRCEFNPSYHLRTFDETKLAGLFGDFELIEIRFVWREKQPLYYGALQRLYSYVRSFPPLARCPKCGHRSNAPSESDDRARTSSIRTIIKNIIPGKMRYRWVICRYGRRRA